MPTAGMLPCPALLCCGNPLCFAMIPRRALLMPCCATMLPVTMLHPEERYQSSERAQQRAGTPTSMAAAGCHEQALVKASWG